MARSRRHGPRRSNAFIGLIALAYSSWVLPKDEPSTTEPFDFLGMLLLSPGLALFLFGFIVTVFGRRPRLGAGRPNQPPTSTT